MKDKTAYRNFRSCTGFTLVDSLISVAILLISIIGTSSMRYYSFLDGRKAQAQISAARIALTLCESWQGLKGDTNYNPVSSLSSIVNATVSQGPVKPSDFTLLGSYKIILDSSNKNANGADYFATLSWKDIQPGLRALNVTVAWAQRGQRDFNNADKSFTLVTYTLN